MSLLRSGDIDVSESTNAIGLPDLRIEVGRFLSYGITGWTADRQTHIDSIINAGVRRVYFGAGHDWSWLRTSYDITLVVADWAYDLPDDFGRFTGPLTYAVEQYKAPIVQISVGDLLNMRARGDLDQHPQFYATRYKATTGATGSRQEILLFPTPDEALVISCEYDVYTGKLATATPYPAGGADLTELYIESCLAVAEQKVDDVPGVHTQMFAVLLQDAIRRDKKRQPMNYGNMGHRESADPGVRPRVDTQGTVYYNDIEVT